MSGLLELNLSSNEEKLILDYVLSWEEGLSMYPKELAELLEKTNLRYVFVAIPTSGYKTEIGVPVSGGGYMLISANRSLDSFVIDAATIPGPKVKCDAFVLQFDLKENDLVRRIRVIDNWISIEGVKMKPIFNEYSETEKQIIEDGLNRGISRIWHKTLKKAF